jgi:hypothetical protein
MNNRIYMKLYLLLYLFMGLAFFSDAQVRPGIKFGVSTPDISPKDFIVTDNNGENYYHLFVVHPRYGIHAGAFVQIQLGGFFIQPEVLYNSSTMDYRIDSLFTPDVISDDLIRDSYRNIDFPLMMGLKTGPVRLGGGPVAHIYIPANSAFGSFGPFEPFFDDLTWGWQAGIGFDFWKLHIDARYEGNFSNLGDYISFFGKRFDFDTKNNRFIASFGFSF